MPVLRMAGSWMHLSQTNAPKEAICKNEDFIDLLIHHVRGLWIWIKFSSSSSCSKFQENSTMKNLYSSIKTPLPSFKVAELMIWIEISGLPLCAWGLNAFKKVASLFGKFRFSKDEESTAMSSRRVCISTRSYKQVSIKIIVEVNGKMIDVQVHEIVEEEVIKVGDTSDLSRPPGFEHMKRSSSSTILIGLPIGGRCYTWMNKESTKIRKLDRFLFFEGILEVIPDIRVKAIDRMWSDHTPILLYVMKSDFGPTPFNFYNSWLNRDGFDDLIKSTWSTLEAPNEGRILESHEKLRYIEKKIDDAHIKWDIEGDENSKFFHGMINNKKRSKAIAGILHDGVWISDPLLIKEVMVYPISRLEPSLRCFYPKQSLKPPRNSSFRGVEQGYELQDKTEYFVDPARTNSCPLFPLVHNHRTWACSRSLDRRPPIGRRDYALLHPIILRHVAKSRSTSPALKYQSLLPTIGSNQEGANHCTISGTLGGTRDILIRRATLILYFLYTSLSPWTTPLNPTSNITSSSQTHFVTPVHPDVQAVDEAFVMENHSQMKPLMQRRMKELSVFNKEKLWAKPAMARYHSRGGYENDADNPSPLTRWIKEFQFLDGLKVPPHVGYYDGKEDPAKFIHVPKGAIRMENWAMPVTYRMFVYILKDAARVCWNSLPKGAVTSYEDLLNGR
ncbi:hypothetical protein Tco_0908271 [Tanacetum coccineum]|uniref:DUF4283 domain-containing protein n=1 Tax=Tanacetum coccineum TaxID=301880 RepID=A0ABQ5CLP9_9ASTR